VAAVAAVSQLGKIKVAVADAVEKLLKRATSP
jgi:hypothetical protein